MTVWRHSTVERRGVWWISERIAVILSNARIVGSASRTVAAMHCHVCNVAVGDGQKFCHACGESLSGVTDPTEPIAAVQSDDEAALLESEKVDPPPVPETHPDPVNETRPNPVHRGAMPDVAGAAVTDDSWWDGSGPEPDPSTMPQPPTQAIESVEPPSSAPVRSLDSVPDDPSLIHTTRQAAPDDVSTEAMSTEAMSAAEGDVTTDAMASEAMVSTAMMDATDSDAAAVDTDRFGSGEHETSQMSGVFDAETGPDPYAEFIEPRQGFRLRASFIFGLLAVIASLMVSVADLIDIRTSRPVDGIVVGFRSIDAFGTNLAVAGFIGAALMLVGGFLSCFGLRWGAGLSGGAGLSLVGWAALVLGRVEVPINNAQQITRSAGNDVNPFLLSITRDLGWFLVIAVAGLGLIVFLVSLRMAGTGGRRGLNPWIAALGALTMVIAAAGPLIPLGGAALDVNLGTGTLPREFFAGRLIQVGLLAVTGVVGFLSVRNYGLGFAAGGVGLAVWLWVTSLLELGDSPVSLAIGNIGTLETTPHAVTSVGMAAALVLLLVAGGMSFATRVRR